MRQGAGRAPTTRSLLANETYPLYSNAPTTVGLVWPNTYETGMSALGFLWVYGQFQIPGVVGCERYFASPPTWQEGTEAISLERHTPLSDCDLVAVSISYETDLINLVRLLSDAGIPPLYADREAHHPPVLIGGPLTLANPVLLQSFADILVVGDGETAMANLLAALQQHPDDLQAALASYSDSASSVTQGQPSTNPLPVVSPLTTPNAALGPLRLVQVSRGCPRACAFCLGRRSEAPFFNAPVEGVLEALNDSPDGIGLIGAALSYYPHLTEVLEAALALDRTVGISSLRAETLTPDLLKLVLRTGTEVLTIAADGPSEKLRLEISKGINEEHLFAAAEMAGRAGFSAMKVYVMLGLPGETEEDVEEFAALVNTLHDDIPILVSPSIFIPKRGTPLAEAPFGPSKVAAKRLKLLMRECSGGIRIGRTSPREAVLQHLLSSATADDASDIVSASLEGGHYADFKAVYPRRMKVFEKG
jgi:radical SAM superfamily enzyme YgiQ (UPF0313 family)